MRRLPILAALIVLAAALFFGYRFVSYFTPIDIAPVDVSSVPDGVHGGRYEHAGFTYEVRTTVRDHRITDITIISNENGRYARDAEAMTDRVLERQSLDADAVTGATTASRILLKTVERSLLEPVRIR